MFDLFGRDESTQFFPFGERERQRSFLWFVYCIFVLRIC